MIQLQQISLHRGQKILLEHADLLIKSQQKIGIVGLNGSGKSSLFLLLQGVLEADKGTVSIPKELRIAHMRQEVPLLPIRAIDYALQGDEEFASLNKKIEDAEEAHDGMALAELHTRMAEIDGYAAPSRAAKILLGLGFSQEQLEHPVKTFSGGWRMRLNLAQVLLSRADVLLLDEPTNHLDLEAIVWLEAFLKESSSTILLISHDREFLDNVVSHIVHLRNQTLQIYTGNYSSFEKTYAEQLALQHATYVKQQKQRQHLQKFVDRFRAKASKAKQAQSRIKMIERMEFVAPVRQESPFHFSFRTAPPGENPMLSFEQVSFGYNDQLILENINLSINSDDRIGLLGPNGAGKSTLIKLFSGELSIEKGMVHLSKKLNIGYFAQHQLEYLKYDQSPLQHLHDLDDTILEREARTYLGGFDFQGDRVFEPIATFSGGEKSRLALALIIWQKPNLLLLDEPTNHLDIEMREALTDALQNYNGALVVVSHDRYLLKSLVDEFWLVSNKKVKPFAGDLDDYRQWVIDQQKTFVSEKQHSSTKKNVPPQKDQKALLSKIEKLEKKLETLQNDKSIVHQQLTDDVLYHSENKTKLDELLAQAETLDKEIVTTEATILGLIEELEE